MSYIHRTRSQHFRTIMCSPTAAIAVGASTNLHKQYESTVSRAKLCASRDCAIKQEPESLYYQIIAMDRPLKRPDSFGRTQAKREALKTRLEQQTQRDTKHIRRAMKQNLVHSATKPKQPQEVKENSSSGIPISFVREVEKRVPPRERETIKTDIPTEPAPVISFQREEQQRPTLGCTPAVSSSLETNFFHQQVASVVKATQRDDQQSSPTLVDDVLEELSELQTRLDSLRRPNRASRDALLDADSELFEFPPDDETEELMEGLSRDEAKATNFSKLVGVLAQQGPPALAEAVVDEGVRMRQFGSQ